MRNFLLSVFWITTAGGVFQLVSILAAIWVLFNSAYTWLELDVNVFVTQCFPWLVWIKTLVVGLLGELGWLIMSVPVLIIAPFKFVTGTIIGLWAYSSAQKLPVEVYG